MGNLTVPVPDQRTAEFYQFFGLWLAGALTLPGGSGGALSGPSAAPAPTAAPALRPWGDSPDDYADAETLWRKYSKNARAMFGLLLDHPGKEFAGEAIAQEVDIPNGAHGVAGVLAWPGRHGMAIGRYLPTEYREDPESLQGYYSIPAERAKVFAAARDKVESAS